MSVKNGPSHDAQYVRPLCSNMSAFLASSLRRLLPAVIKTYFFGFAIGLIGCHIGYSANKGTESVGKAANAAVVYSSLTIFIIDMIAVQITSLLF